MRINEFTPLSSMFEDMKIYGGVENKSNEKENDFFAVLKDKLDAVNEKQVTSENTTSAFISGEEVDVHKVMLDAEEAKLSLELAVQMRNKIVEAYQEINRMQL
ncbi:flagellar hook-basal body complex protein FliE [Clostridium pascui]|uniref:flagellar hook-basal body complex protein FliE n=1 Tax=Clostridium pascui TaxID=46609 RepID=UPI00195D09BB|nr:flagellar hook-basal body complex protein FliE [Clostridium pascui]MBM7869419.1 flagellar hook-basal body complex protein FliE [Clostridium pascui]